MDPFPQTASSAIVLAPARQRTRSEASYWLTISSKKGLTIASHSLLPIASRNEFEILPARLMNEPERRT